MTLKERFFETGYIVEMRDGDKYLVLRRGSVENRVHLMYLGLDCINKSYWMNHWKVIDYYDDDLRYKLESKEGRELDIVKVYDCINDKTKVVWEREEN